MNSAPPPPGRFRIERFEQITVRNQPDGIVKGILPNSGLAVLFGDSASGKSFLALDMAICVASGRPMGGRETRQGAVVFVAAEGVDGMRMRIAALRQHLDIHQLPFGLLADAPDLGHLDGDTNLLIDAIRKQVSEEIRFIVIDTLAVVMAGADENAAKDMSALARNCHRIANTLGCVVMIVHHSGKDSARGARGSSALRASADTEILVERSSNGSRTAKITKQKDGPDGLMLRFDLEIISIAHNGYTSCIIRTGEWSSSPITTGSISRSSRRALETLHKLVAEKGELPPVELAMTGTNRVVRLTDWRAACEADKITAADKPDARRKAFKRAAESLENSGKVRVSGDWVWVIE